MRRSVAAISLLLSLELASPAPAVAQESASSTVPVSPARDLHRRGLELFDLGDYARALPYFQSAQALVQSHAAARNIALCLDALGRQAEALQAYEALLRDHAGSLTEEERAATSARIATLRDAVRIDLPGPASSSPRSETARAAPVSSSGAARGSAEGGARKDEIESGRGGREAAIDAQPAGSPREAPAFPAAVEETPRWTGRIFFGYSAAPTLGLDAESRAGSTCGDRCPDASGVLAGVGFDHALSASLFLGLSAGYLRLASDFTHEEGWGFGAASEYALTYRLSRDMVLQGPFAGPSLGLRLSPFRHFTVVGRLGVAILAARSEISLSGDAVGHTGAPAPLEPERTAAWSASVLVTPEVGVEVSVGPFFVGAGMGLLVSTLPGPAWSGQGQRVQDRDACTESAPGAGACSPDLPPSVEARAFGAFVAAAPQVSLRMPFH